MRTFIPPPPVYEVDNPMYIVPYVPTPKKVIDKVMELAEIKPNMVFCDLGCGDGRILIEAARRGALAIGVEINEDLVKEARAKVKEVGLDGKVIITHGDLFKYKYVSYADVIYMFLDSKGVSLVKELLEKYAKPGAKVISLTYPIPGWEPEKVVTVKMLLEDRTLYIYRVKGGVSEVKEALRTTSEYVGGSTSEVRESIETEEVIVTKPSKPKSLGEEIRDILKSLCGRYGVEFSDDLTLREILHALEPHLERKHYELINTLISSYERYLYARRGYGENELRELIKEIKRKLKLH